MDRASGRECRIFSLSGSTGGRLILLLAVLIFAGGILSGLPAAGVRAAVDPTGRGVGFTTELYDNTKGLPTSDANAIVQTKEGFIWIGTYSGLIRYDGNEFYRYDSSTGVSSVVSLFEDTKGRLWIGTNDSGVFVLKDNEFQSYDRKEGLLSSSVRSILEDEDGNILIATTTGMAYVDQEGAMHVIEDAQIQKEYICELVRGKDNVIYGITLSGDFFTMKDLRVTAYYSSDSLGYGLINTVYPDPTEAGRIYMGMQDGSIVYGDLTKGMADSKIISTGSQMMVRCIKYADGVVWVCSNTGIGILNGYTYMPLPDLPMNNSVEHVMEDYEGNIWFTSSRQGVMKIVKNRFFDISGYAELPSMVVNSTCLKDGLLYLGTDNGLIILRNNEEKVENKITKLLEGDRIRSIQMDVNGTLWLGTNSDHGLVHYDTDKDTWELYNTENGLASNRARTVFPLSDGRMAVATSAGVNIIENGTVTEVYDDTKGISNEEILCLEEGPNGKIYAGSDGNGIYIIDQGKVSRLGRDDGLRSEVILRMRKDPVEDDLYWIITSNSIAYMKGEKITSIRHFPYANNFDMYFDNQDCIWVLSSNGLYVVKREDMLADKRIDYTLYDTKSGLPCAPTANSYSWLGEDGTLYIAASTGVSSVNVFDDSDKNGEVHLVVPFLIADDTYIPVKGNEVHIPARCKRLTINAYAFSYSLNNPHLSYRLEGFDDKTVRLTQQEMRPLTYTNLAGGTYNFTFSVIDTMTDQAEQTLNLTLIKDKTIYEQKWFWALLVLLALCLVACIITLYFRQKTKALLKKQAMNRQFINEMTSVFANCIDMKDPYTNGHSHRVAEYSKRLARKLGKTEDEVEEIYHIALLHDIGKISIPDSILNKPGRLTDEEFQVMRDHSRRGFEILKEITIDPQLAIGAGYHHERLDGRGYPNGLSGDQIPEMAQIIAVADTFDAMYSSRPYRKRMDINDVAAEIRRVSGTQLNSAVVDALMLLIEEDAIEDVANLKGKSAE